jgi:hypothetical protein
VDLSNTLKYINLTGVVVGLVAFRGPIHLCTCVSERVRTERKRVRTSHEIHWDKYSTETEIVVVYYESRKRKSISVTLPRTSELKFVEP